VNVHKERNEWFYLLPIIFVFSILPLIVYLKVIPLTGVTYDYWVGTEENYDFFSYYKAVALVCCAVFALVFVIIRAFFGTKLYKELKTYYFAAGFYGICIIASTLASENISVAIMGFPDRYEGLIVLLSYLVLLFATTVLVSNERHVKIIIGALVVGALLISVIGIFQYFGYDLFKTDFGKKLILPEEYHSLADSLTFAFDKHTIYATLFHYNYVGSYAAMLAPLCLVLSLLSKDKKVKIPMVIMTVATAFLVIGSNARSGIVGSIIAILVFILVEYKYVKKYWKTSLAALFLILGLSICLNQISGGYIGNRSQSLINDVKQVFGIAKNDKSDSNNSQPILDIKESDNSYSITTSLGTLKISYKNNALSFYDEQSNPINTSYDSKNNTITLIHPKFEKYKVQLFNYNDKLYLNLIKENISLFFALEPEGIKLVDFKGKEFEFGPVESWGFKGAEKLGSARGYIWSRSLPLLKDSLLLGYGPDTFAIVFPQNDILGKLVAYGDMWHIVDKPHNLYLQIAISTGVVSLIVFLFLVGYYLYQSFRIYIRISSNTFSSQAGVAIFVGIIGYLVTGFFNDSVVSVAPIFWCLLGLGIKINHLVLSKESRFGKDDKT